MTCSNQMRQLGLAVIQYENTHRYYPPPYMTNPKHGVLTFILPFMEGDRDVVEGYNWNAHWTDNNANSAGNTNFNLTRRRIETFICPSAFQGRNWVTDYTPTVEIAAKAYQPLISRKYMTQRSDWTGILPPADAEGNPRLTSARDVTDGLSKTWLFAEDAGRQWRYEGGFRVFGTTPAAYWAADNIWLSVSDPCDGSRLINCHNDDEIYSFHPGGSQFLFGDGSVHFHPEDLDADVFASLFTRASGDLLEQLPE